MDYKYKINDKFKIKINNDEYIGIILRIAKLDEFGADFYYDEKNYVVNFFQNDKIFNTKPIASYNFSYKERYLYIMTEDEINLI